MDNVRFSVILCCLLLSACAMTVNGQPTDITTFFQNLQASYHGIWRLVTAFAYLTGACFITLAIFQLKIYGEMRTMMTGQHNIWRPITYLTIGAVLMMLPAAFHAMMITTFGYSNYLPINYAETDVVTWGKQTFTITPAVLGFVQIVGLVAFVRGWISLVKITEQGGQHSFGKSVTFIIGGLFCINIEGTKNIIFSLFTPAGS